jgi:HEPN domain-containing protein
MRPPDVVARELAREWLAKADVDLSAASALLATDAHFDTIAFHAQQAAEKALKPFLVWHQVEFPKTHDIKRLLVLCRPIDAGLAEALADAAALTPFGVDYRYPGDYPAVSKQMAEASLATAGQVVTSVAERLSVDHPAARE